MAATTKWYGAGARGFLDGTANAVWDWNTDTIKVSLHTVTYVPDYDVHDFWNDVTNEVTSANYTTGGATLATPTVTVVGASDYVSLDAVDVSWTPVTFTARYAVIYKSTGVAATSPLIAAVDFGADQTVSAATFTIVWDATGVLKATY